RVAPRLEPGRYGDNMVLPRRVVLGVAGGTLSAGALFGFGVDEVAGQEEVWNVGDPDTPADVYGDEVRVATLTIEDENALISNAASGSVDLSDGSATVSTGLDDSEATFYLALGIDDPGADADVAGRLRWDDGDGEYVVVVDEIDTSEDPTVYYDILRVR
ncbi:MAG: hypothetical protein ACLFSD_00050, partial [Salinivenus sp.]